MGETAGGEAEARREEKNFLKVTSLILTEPRPRLGLLAPGSSRPTTRRGETSQASGRAGQRTRDRARASVGQKSIVAESRAAAASL